VRSGWPCANHRESPPWTPIRPIAQTTCSGPVERGQDQENLLRQGQHDRVTVVAKDDITAGDGAKRAPSAVPVMTVLELANAVLQILSARNLRLYAKVRGEIENRIVNTLQI
jgi:hypothetical protein